MPADVIGLGPTTPSEGAEDLSQVDRAAITFADPAVGKLSVLFFMGANGMGKTTTVGKVASRLRIQGGQKVLLAAADTFRYCTCCHFFMCRYCCVCFPCL